MGKRFLNGIVTGAGFIAVVAVAFAIAWAGDVFTIDKDGTSKFVVSDQGKITVGATESYVNLVIQNDEVVAEADNKVDITADVLTVEGIRLENLNVSANIESGGAGGLDTGAESGNTWYYVWIVTNNIGTSSNGLLSTSSTSPTLPSGFTKKRRVGAVRNNTTSNFFQFVQEGNVVTYTEGADNPYILPGGQATTWTTVSATNYIPPTSRRGLFYVSSNTTHNTVGTLFTVRVRKTGVTLTEAAVGAVTQVADVLMPVSSTRICDTNASQQIDYYIYNVPSGGGGAYIAVLGYYDRI